MGFNHRPIITALTTTAAGGYLSTGVYQFAVTYIREDSRGNFVESMPSAIFSVTTPGNLYGYTPTAMAYGITGNNNVRFRLYRSVANGSTLYLDDLWTKYVNEGSVIPGASDADIIANTPMPTTGGILPNQPMPSCRVVIEHQNRLWCAGAETGDGVYFSQPISQNIAPEWNRLLYRRIPRNAGRVVNLVSLDEKIIVFCENRIGFIYGEGPTRTGAQDGFSQFVEAVSGYSIPWNQPHSVIRTTDGIWFRSSFGFRLLGRNMQIVKQNGSDLSSELDASILNLTVTRALASATGNQVRFYMSDGSVYVFDTVYGQWSQFTNFSAVDCASIGDDYYHVNSSALLYAQTKSALYDDTIEITSSLTTGWLSVAGLQGFQRISRIQLLGQLSTADAEGYTILVQAAYDFVDGVFSTLYSGPLPRRAVGSTVHQIEVQPTTQKCESVQIKITVTPSGASADGTRPLRLTAMNLIVGAKSGRAKLTAAQKL